MKALTFKRYGKSPEIGFADVPRPTPKPEEKPVIEDGETPSSFASFKRFSSMSHTIITEGL